jgi:hypothetical protein
MQLVEEEYDFALARTALLDDSLKPLLKLSTILRAGYYCSKIEGKYPTVL